MQIARYLIPFGHEVAVIEPPELKERMLQAAEKIFEQYRER